MKTVQTKNDVSNILSSHREEIERFGEGLRKIAAGFT